MALDENPDFHRWLARFEQAQTPHPSAGSSRCDGCGAALTDPSPTSLPYCMVCLAEQFGRDRAEAAAKVAAALRVALATAPEPPSPDDVRAAVQTVLDDYEDAVRPRRRR